MTTKELVTGKNDGWKKTLLYGGSVLVLILVLVGVAWLMSHAPSHTDAPAAQLEDGKMAVTQQIYEQASPADGLVQVGDIVKLIGVSGKGNIYPAELEYVQVLHISGRNDAMNVDGTVQDGRLTLQLALTDKQMEKLYELRETYSITVAVVSRGDPARAQELLTQQEEILQQLQQDEAEETTKSAAEAATEAAKQAAADAPKTPAGQPVTIA